MTGGTGTNSQAILPSSHDWSLADIAERTGPVVALADLRTLWRGTEVRQQAASGV